MRLLIRESACREADWPSTGGEEDGWLGGYGRDCQGATL